MIPFNKPSVVGQELTYVQQAIANGRLASEGPFNELCQSFLERKFDIDKVLMTSSCTAALEIAALLCEFQPGDEVLMPSYTFVTTASAFVRAGAGPVFVDIRGDTFNIDDALIEQAITPRTRAICVVHYAGIACEMKTILEIARKHNLIVIEDAAHAVGAYYNDRALGSIGDLGCFSFHETKNISCGEGGALCINNPRFADRAEIIHDKGTNRRQFFRGQVDKYTWVDQGSSYGLTEICAAFLLGQMEKLDELSRKRKALYDGYLLGLGQLQEKDEVRLPTIPSHCRSNHHLFSLLTKSLAERDAILEFLRMDEIEAVFHYVPLHSSPIGKKISSDTHLAVTQEVSSRLVRLPLFFELTNDEVKRIVARVCRFFGDRSFRNETQQRTKRTKSNPIS